MADLGERTIAVRLIAPFVIPSVFPSAFASVFADVTCEGPRRIVGPYLASLQASGTVVGIVAGFGELLGDDRLSKRIADFTYVVQMTLVAAPALSESWPATAQPALEPVGEVIRNPPPDVMISPAGRAGWRMPAGVALHAGRHGKIAAAGGPPAPAAQGLDLSARRDSCCRGLRRLSAHCAFAG